MAEKKEGLTDLEKAIIVKHHELTKLTPKKDLVEIEVELDGEVFTYIHSFKKKLKVCDSAVVAAFIEEYLNSAQVRSVSKKASKRKRVRNKKRGS